MKKLRVLLLVCFTTSLIISCSSVLHGKFSGEERNIFGYARNAKNLSRAVKSRIHKWPNVNNQTSLTPKENFLKKVLLRRKKRKRENTTKPDEKIPNIDESNTNRTLLHKLEHKKGRFLSLFTVIRFANEDCEADSGGNGTCYTRSDCSDRGGRSDGTCANGYGVCCKFEFSCGTTTSENGTYFENPTGVQERICNFQLARANNDICQIRLELEQFDLSQPNSVGACETDFLLVTGASGTGVPTICGINSGQHFYSVTANGGPTMLSVILDTTLTVSSSRTWSIRILQIECDNRNIAPVGCLQYFTGETGELKSFNYRSDGNSNNNNNPFHLANLNYAICIRAAHGYCGIKYSQPSTDPYSFTLSGDASGTLSFPLGGVMLGDADCDTDYVSIPGGSGDGALGPFARDRYCGVTLGVCAPSTPGAVTCGPTIMAVTTFVMPFTVHVVTDNVEETAGDLANRGFHLSYSQTPCQAG